LTAAPRSAGSIIRKVLAALVLVPLAVLIVAFAVANRQDVTVSFDPFSSNIPAASVTQPLFVVIIVVLIAGVVIGGAASWLRHGGWRRTARRLEREVALLRSELETRKQTAGVAPVNLPEPVEPPERLKLRPPLH
jgi:uncharacterized integral membrane protein